MKSLSHSDDLIKFIEGADFYNKIQVTNSTGTETFWYLRDDAKWIRGHDEGVGGDISRDGILAKLGDLPDDSEVLLAGNDTVGVLHYHF